MPTVFARVKDIVVERFHIEDPDALTEETSFKDDLEMDSLALVDLIMAIEPEFQVAGENVHITDKAADDIRTIGQVVEYLKDQGIQDT